MEKNVSYEKYYTNELIALAKEGDKESMDRLVRQNIPLVKSLVKKYAYLPDSSEDLFQIGVLGLIKAIKGFNFDFNTKFSTYAVYIINGELKRHFRDDGIIKVSRTLKSIYIKIRATQEKFYRQNGQEPTYQELADIIGESVEDIILSLEACQSPEYIYSSVGEDDGKEKFLGDYIEDKSFNINDHIDRIALKTALASLNVEERKIIMLRYFRGKTQREVGQMIGMTQVQVSRCEKKIIATIRKEFEGG